MVAALAYKPVRHGYKALGVVPRAGMDSGDVKALAEYFAEDALNLKAGRLRWEALGELCQRLVKVGTLEGASLTATGNLTRARLLLGYVGIVADWGDDSLDDALVWLDEALGCEC